MRRRDHNHGQSAVELVAVTGVLAAVGFVVIQLVVAAASWIGVAGALRVGARADLVGGSREAAQERALAGVGRDDVTFGRGRRPGSPWRGRITLRAAGAGLAVTVPETAP